MFDVFKNDGHCYRIGGDEFVVLAYNCKEDQINSKLDVFRMRCNEVSREKPYSLEVAIGYSYYKVGCGDSIEEVVKRTDKNMYENKRLMKKS